MPSFRRKGSRWWPNFPLSRSHWKRHVCHTVRRLHSSIVIIFGRHLYVVENNLPLIWEDTNMRGLRLSGLAEGIAIRFVALSAIISFIGIASPWGISFALFFQWWETRNLANFKLRDNIEIMRAVVVPSYSHISPILVNSRALLLNISVNSLEEIIENPITLSPIIFLPRNLSFCIQLRHKIPFRNVNEQFALKTPHIKRNRAL